MASLPFNIALGRAVELHRRVTGDDPVNSALVVLALRTTGLATDGTLQDRVTLAEIFTDTTREVTNTGYSRKVLTEAELTAATSADNINNRYDISIPNITWTSIQPGDQWSKIVIAYDADTTTGTDANITPISFHDFVITPDGSDIVCVIPTSGFYRATPL